MNINLFHMPRGSEAHKFNPEATVIELNPRGAKNPAFEKTLAISRADRERNKALSKGEKDSALAKKIDTWYVDDEVEQAKREIEIIKARATIKNQKSPEQLAKEEKIKAYEKANTVEVHDSITDLIQDLDDELYVLEHDPRNVFARAFTWFGRRKKAKEIKQQIHNLIEVQHVQLGVHEDKEEDAQIKGAKSQEKDAQTQ